MLDAKHITHGGFELIGYIFFLILYFVAIDPMLTLDDIKASELAKSNPQVQNVLNTADKISNSGEKISDLRSLEHQFTNIFICPALGFGILGRRVLAAMRDE